MGCATSIREDAGPAAGAGARKQAEREDSEVRRDRNTSTQLLLRQTSSGAHSPAEKSAGIGAKSAVTNDTQKKKQAEKGPERYQAVREKFLRVRTGKLHIGKLASQFLARHQISELKGEFKDTVCVNRNETVQHALVLLQEHDVLSVPVVDSRFLTTDPRHYMGIVSIMDIVTALVFQPVFERFDTLQALSDLDRGAFQQMQRLSLFELEVMHILGLSRESQLTQGAFLFEEDDHMDKLMDTFTAGIHRVIVRPRVPDKRPRFLSQTDILRFLYKHGSTETASTPESHHWLGRMMYQSVGFLGLVQWSDRRRKRHVKPHSHDAKSDQRRREEQGLLTLPSNSTALAGFRLALKSDVNALPVVDADGKLVAALSTADLRGITAATFVDLLSPVLDFLLARNEEHMLRFVVCSPTDNLMTVIELMLENHTHRVWVVDDMRRPVGVITNTDVIVLFSPYSGAMDCTTDEPLPAIPPVAEKEEGAQQ